MPKSIACARPSSSSISLRGDQICQSSRIIEQRRSSGVKALRLTSTMTIALAVMVLMMPRSFAKFCAHAGSWLVLPDRSRLVTEYPVSASLNTFYAICLQLWSIIVILE